MISLCALETGKWQMLEPITLPHWDLLQEKDRQEALEYIDREDPDLLVLAWPCTVWSMLQTLGKKTEEQVERRKSVDEQSLEGGSNHQGIRRNEFWMH